jgi:hypothetical protein
MVQEDVLSLEKCPHSFTSTNRFRMTSRFVEPVGLITGRELGVRIPSWYSRAPRFNSNIELVRQDRFYSTAQLTLADDHY